MGEEDVNIGYLESVHRLMIQSQGHIDMLDQILLKNDYSKVRVKSWHILLNDLKVDIVVLRHLVQALVEADLKNEEKIKELTNE